MNKDTYIKVRVTDETKQRAEALADELGINVSQLVRMIIHSTTLKWSPNIDLGEKFNQANTRLKAKSNKGKVLAK